MIKDHLRRNRAGVVERSALDDGQSSARIHYREKPTAAGSAKMPGDGAPATANIAIARRLARNVYVAVGKSGDGRMSGACGFATIRTAAMPRQDGVSRGLIPDFTAQAAAFHLRHLSSLISVNLGFHQNSRNQRIY